MFMFIFSSSNSSSVDGRCRNLLTIIHVNCHHRFTSPVTCYVTDVHVASWELLSRPEPESNDHPSNLS
ncbi:hypothetical protein LSAT2_021457 [Lamellibrachia satsuma]|nr:hypothetical protein LSAT2_021457 [Lamellibrachia satsuma]